MELYATVIYLLTVLVAFTQDTSKKSTILLTQSSECHKWDPMKVWLSEGDVLYLVWSGNKIHNCTVQIMAKYEVSEFCMTVLQYKVPNCSTTMSYIKFYPFPDAEVFNCQKLPLSQCSSGIHKLTITINSSPSPGSSIQLLISGGKMPVTDENSEEGDSKSSSFYWILLPAIFFLLLVLLGSFYWKYKKGSQLESQQRQVRRIQARPMLETRHSHSQRRENPQSVQSQFPRPSQPVLQITPFSTESTPLSQHASQDFMEPVPMAPPPSYEDVFILDHGEEPPPPYPGRR